MRAALAPAARRRHEFIDHLDDGSPIAVAITIAGDRAQAIDFTGTGPVLPGNLNANRAIVTAAVMYVLPLPDRRRHSAQREACSPPIEIVLPQCLLNPPPHDSPETVRGRSSAATSRRRSGWSMCCSAHFDVAAASQGTMNNLTLRRRDVRLLRNDRRRRRGDAPTPTGPTPCIRT